MDTRFDARRLNAALALRGERFNAFAVRLGVSPGHLREVVSGARVPSERLVAAMERELADAWDFVVGSSSALVAEAATNSKFPQ